MGEVAVQCGGIVLCGGQSRRMGTDKAALLFAEQPMLARVVDRLQAAVSPVLVVAAVNQNLPALPAEVVIVRDLRPDRGPLEGLAAGLRALPEGVEVAFIAGCDVPLLAPAFIRRMIELLGDADAAVPEFDNRLHPLSAVYRRGVLAQVQRMLADDHLRLQSLFERISTRRVGPDELRDVDPKLRSLWNINSPEDYRAALAAQED
jgi:molybdopterin-guanine dinucleotide biosynthesis protein A